MAAKVNTKFVVTLGLVLTLVFLGAVYVGYQALRKSGDEYIALGDKAMAESDYPKAMELYGKAVFKDQRNSAWIRKWLSAIEKDTPKDRASYFDEFQGKYLAALQALAEADRSDFEANRRWLDARWEVLRSGSNLGAIESFRDLVTQYAGAFQGDEGQKARLWRYRGLALVAMLPYNSDLKADQLDIARKDLEASLKVDPADSEANIALCAIDLTLAERDRKNDKVDEANGLDKAADDRLAEFIKAHPPAAAARLQQIRMTVGRAARNAPADVPFSAADVLRDRKAMVDEFIGAFMQEKPENLEPGLVDSAVQMARAVYPSEEAARKMSELYDHASPAGSPRADILLTQAINQFKAGSLDDLKAALVTLDRVINLPDKPVSLEGAALFGLRTRAVQQKTFVAFAMWLREKDLSKKQEDAALAKKFRDDFVAIVGENNDEVLSIDARLAMINGDFRGATTLISRYNQQTHNSVPLSVALEGTLQAQQGNTGPAEACFKRVLELDPDNVGAIEMLAKIAQDKPDYRQALVYANALVKLKPTDEAARKQKELLEQLANNRIKDPVLDVLFQTNNQLLGVDSDPAKAEATLRKALADPAMKSDLRLHEALIMLMARSGKKDQAIAAVDAALATSPSKDIVEKLNTLRAQLSSTEDPQVRRMREIDQSTGLTEVQKHLARYELLSASEKPDEAKAELDKAAALAPTDPLVAEYRFDDAIRRKDTKAIAELVDLAEKNNLDKAGGRLYRARMLALNGQMPEAAQMLRGVLEKDQANFMGWRVLGSVLLTQDNYLAAADAYDKAVKIRPTDPRVIVGRVRSLILANRTAEALAEARKYENAAAGDSTFREMYIQLEFDAPGGNPDRALELRRSRMASDPGDKNNISRLATMLTDKGLWDEAKAAIDRLRNDPDRAFEVAGLDARWFGKQGKFDDAAKVLDTALAALPADKRNEGPYLACSQLFMSLGRTDLAVAFLEKGRPVQKKETMVIDRQLGDVLFAAQKVPEALAAYKRVLDAGSPDKGDAVAKRMLEGYVNLKDWAKFDALLAAMGERAQTDSTLLLLAAEAANRQGDPARADTLYGKAVAADPKNFMVYVQRGDFLLNDPKRLRDAQADYEQAERLAPDNPSPLVRLATMFANQGNFKDASQKMDRALAIDPANDSNRLLAIQIRVEAQQPAEVADLIDKGIELNPTGLGWYVKGGEVMMGKINRPDDAARYYASAWKLQKDAVTAAESQPEAVRKQQVRNLLRIAIPYVTALLSHDPPVLDQALAVINDRILEKADEMPRRMLRAMVLVRAKKATDAEREIGRALAILDQDDPDQVALFAEGMQSAYLDRAERIAVMQRLEQAVPFKSWLKAHALMDRLQDTSAAPSAATDLEALADASDKPQFKASIYKMLASYHYQVANYAASVEQYRKELAIAPNDAGSLNNCAYMLATRLNKPNEALPMAEKAAELLPDSGTVLDTLGSVHLELKDFAKAEGLFRKALNMAKSDTERVPLNIHLARAIFLQGNKADAQKLRDDVRVMLNGKPQLEQQFGPDLKELTQQIDSQ